MMAPAEKLAIGKALAASGGASSVALVAATVVVAPLVEELLYRGYLLGALRERMPGFAAVLVSALLFVFVLHFEPANLVAALCLGLATGWCALRTGSLRIVADSVHHVLDVLTAFRERHPGIQVSIAQGNTGRIVETLIGYDAEIGVLGELGDERPFEVLLLNVSPIIAFAAKGHPAAARAHLTLQDLASWPLVIRERGSRTRQLLEQRAAEQGATLGYAVEAEGREAVRAIVAAGGGIGFVSAAEFGEDDQRIARIPLDGPPLLMHEKLICLHERRNSKAIQAFFALARSLRG